MAPRFAQATTNMVGSDGSRIPEEMMARRDRLDLIRERLGANNIPPVLPVSSTPALVAALPQVNVTGASIENFPPTSADPRAVKNHEASTNVSLQSKNPTSLPSCLLDRGIKIEKIMKLFFVKNELVGLCKYKNCLVMQIVTVEKIKEVDPQALLRAYEPLFWDTQTNG
ncbi:unnamed protein product, partial [Mesorhabditis belari]